ncbi:MAG TPA: LacI family DNA-binding transcriptional regulator [Ktedonobacteraceae bacterium]|jgi:DNA-binding LacI/PurR family transcriptional regulator
MKTQREPGGPPPTSFDVARRAGVSQSTVSLVLNGKTAGRVSQRVQQAVLQAARELGYQPCLPARTLRLGRTRIAALIIPDVANPVFATVLQGAELSARQRDYTVVQVSTGNDTDWQQRIVHALATRSIDGFILFAVDLPTPANLELLRGSAVLVDGDAPDFPALLLDIAAGASAAMQHLLDLGHRRIAHLAAHIDGETFRRRQQVYEQMLHHAGIPLRADYLATSGIDLAEAWSASLSLLECADPPTAIFCDDDLLAAGVYKAASNLHLQVPTDLSVVGFCDGLVASLLDPPLTTVVVPALEVGRRAMDLLLSTLETELAPAKELVPLRFVVRASTAPPCERL